MDVLGRVVAASQKHDAARPDQVHVVTGVLERFNAVYV